MRKILVVIMCALMLLGLTACGDGEPSKTVVDGLYTIYIDEDTGVNYIFYKNGYGGGLSPRYNADGTLYVSEVE